MYVLVQFNVCKREGKRHDAGGSRRDTFGKVGYVPSNKQQAHETADGVLPVAKLSDVVLLVTRSVDDDG